MTISVVRVFLELIVEIIVCFCELDKIGVMFVVVTDVLGHVVIYTLLKY